MSKIVGKVGERRRQGKEKEMGEKERERGGREGGRERERGKESDFFSTLFAGRGLVT